MSSPHTNPNMMSMLCDTNSDVPGRLPPATDQQRFHARPFIHLIGPRVDRRDASEAMCFIFSRSPRMEGLRMVPLKLPIIIFGARPMPSRNVRFCSIIAANIRSVGGKR
ncbi:hypothetical protein [Nitrosospira sp. Nsp2]|uniref:hypothetical protein n=1 Tax=Nitrosospira sp. Nsp2 TaxID=136548 RepID=UPI0021595D86|nr:hypothetical protein [Nitrosospira sp. Nsp2]